MDLSYLDRLSRLQISVCWLSRQDKTKGLMVDFQVEIPTAFETDASTKEYVHIRIQQRNGRKSLTTVQGLHKELSYDRILKDLKKAFCCNGTVVNDKELGKVIQLQGDQRKNVSTFILQAGIVNKDQIKVHGF